MSADTKYSSVPKPPPFRPHGGEPGCDGAPLTEVVLRDLPDGEQSRELKVQRRVDILDKMVDEGKIESFHREAARKFQNDAEVSQRTSTSAGEFQCGGHRTAYELSNASLEGARRCTEARQRLRRVLHELGPYGEVFAVAVLLNRATFADACRFCGWPRKMGPHALREILYQLARFYGLAPGEGDSRTRTWRAEA